MCFAAPKYYQLGWLSDRHVDISDGGTWSGKMYGISTYSSSASGDATVVRIDASTDLYVSYNLATGISSGTQEAANQVIVHSKTTGTTSYGLSFIEKTISTGGTETVNGNEIKFVSTGNGYANIEINQSSTPPPTSGPNPSPTPPPTTAPNPNPTTAPTSAPTPPPTSTPTPSPTTAPTPTPTSAPPTPSPTTAPNPNPTPSPTVDDDDDAECADDPTFFFEQNNGRTRFCNWFTNRKVQCYRKPGALDACPEACGICDKSNTEICTDIRMKKKACIATSFCFWDRSARPRVCAAN